MNVRLKFVLITLATLVAVGTTASLGLWQLSRATEKQSRQAALDAQNAKLPLTASAVRAAADPLTLLHQRARLRGSWQQGSVIFLDNRPMDGRAGFIVLAVLQMEGGGALVVQRGWAPRGIADRALLPTVDTPAGVVEIDGRMALPPSDLYALGGPMSGVLRQNLDMPQFRAETGLPLLPITLQQTGDSGERLLRDWPVVNLGVEKNYGYAAQWFGLTLLFSLLYLWFQIVRPLIDRQKDVASNV